MAFPKMGRQLGTNREFWVNNRTNLSQWSRPFYPRTFRASDIELNVFVDILIRKNIFPKWLVLLSYIIIFIPLNFIFETI